MDARQEQDYYDRAAENHALLEKVFSIAKHARSLASRLLALTQSERGHFGHALREPNKMPSCYFCSKMGVIVMTKEDDKAAVLAVLESETAAYF